MKVDAQLGHMLWPLSPLECRMRIENPADGNVGSSLHTWTIKEEMNRDIKGKDSINVLKVLNPISEIM